MNIILYYAPITCSMVPFITLTEAGASFETVKVNFRKGDNRSAEYLAINPRHKVPVLSIDGRILTENVAIHQWVHRTFPEAGILPSDSWAEIQAVSLLSWFSSGIHPFLSRIFSPIKVCDTPGSADSVVALARKTIEENFQIADNRLQGSDYFFDRFSAPDAHFFWCCRRATQFDIELDPFTNVVRHFERMQTRASVQKLLSFEKETMDEFARAV